MALYLHEDDSTASGKSVKILTKAEPILMLRSCLLLVKLDMQMQPGSARSAKLKLSVAFMPMLMMNLSKKC